MEQKKRKTNVLKEKCDDFLCYMKMSLNITRAFHLTISHLFDSFFGCVNTKTKSVFGLCKYI